MGTKSPNRRSPEMEADARWHLDKRVPITLLLAIIAQTGGAFWWGATTSERINYLERQANMTAPQGDRLTRVEVKLEVMQDGINEIKRLITQRPR